MITATLERYTARNDDFVPVVRSDGEPYSGPRRAERAKRYWQPARALPGYLGQSSWLVRLTGVTILGAALGLLWPSHAQGQTARERYADAQNKEQTARQAMDGATQGSPAEVSVMADTRAVVAAYESLVRRYPISGYSDNALMNGASLAEALYQRFGQPRDRQTALKLYRRLVAEYPASSLTRQSELAIARLDQGPPPSVGAPGAVPTASTAAGRATLTSIERTILPEAVRITLALDREVAYRDETLTGPARVFFDLKGVQPAPNLVDAVLRFPSDVVRQIRVGRHPNSTVRVVLDLEGVSRHSVYTLYNPFRLVIDCEAAAGTPAQSVDVPAKPAPAPVGADIVPAATAMRGGSTSPPVVAVAVPTEAVAPVAAPATTPGATPSPAPEVPNANTAGGFSLSRQLGLGVSRIVIDPGHGGHDPGAQARGLTEAELTLDVALRLEKLLLNEPGLEVVLTRRTSEYIPLEERTAIANREAADVFLSIHANASRNAAARGVETYFLSFAATPEAEAVAARENSASAGGMHNLPDIIKTIALNNKLDESRDLAGMVQEALVTRLRRSNTSVRNLGVKKAPFVVLIGAGMPSVLAEVSFLTNKQELQLLKTSSYKQRIAEALHAAVMRYRRALKGAGAIALQ